MPDCGRHPLLRVWHSLTSTRRLMVWSIAVTPCLLGLLKGVGDGARRTDYYVRKRDAFEVLDSAYRRN